MYTKQINIVEKQAELKLPGLSITIDVLHEYCKLNPVVTDNKVYREIKEGIEASILDGMDRYPASKPILAKILDNVELITQVNFIAWKNNTHYFLFEQLSSLVTELDISNMTTILSALSFVDVVSSLPGYGARIVNDYLENSSILFIKEYTDIELGKIHDQISWLERIKDRFYLNSAESMDNYNYSNNFLKEKNRNRLYKAIEKVQAIVGQLIKNALAVNKYSLDEAILKFPLDYFWDKYFEIITIPERFEGPPETSKNRDAIPYAPMSYKYIVEIAKFLELKMDDVFVDFGCGMGRVINYFATKSLKRVVGVEFNDRLATIAKDNLIKNKYLMADYEVHSVDAAKYEFSDDETIVYLFNSFGRATVCDVLNNLEKSIKRNPREVTFIYIAGMYDLLDKYPWLKYQSEMPCSGGHIWKFKP